MAGGYSEFKSAGKAPVTGDQIGPGQITLAHLDSGLFSEIRNIALHSHTGAKSRRINLKDLEGTIGPMGFQMHSSDGTKKYQVTINSATNQFVLTQIT